ALKKHKIPSLPQPPIHQSSTLLPPPTHLDILRYRTHHGTNLGSIFVLEKWLYPSLFSYTDSDSELDAVTAYARPPPPPSILSWPSVPPAEKIVLDASKRLASKLHARNGNTIGPLL
ncbi:MAG: hypothetical protein Q9164_007648, partial [Protoblastenia rupestris]